MGSSQSIPRAADGQAASIEDMRVQHRRSHIAMPEQLLDRADVISPFEQMGRKRVAQAVARRWLCNPTCSDSRTERTLDRCRMQVIAAAHGPEIPTANTIHDRHWDTSS